MLFEPVGVAARAFRASLVALQLWTAQRDRALDQVGLRLEALVYAEEVRRAVEAHRLEVLEERVHRPAPWFRTPPHGIADTHDEVHVAAVQCQTVATRSRKPSR